MSDKRKAYNVRVSFTPDHYRRIIYANSEEEAIEKFREENELYILYNWIKYVAEPEEG